jgi:hypothetical protein
MNLMIYGFVGVVCGVIGMAVGDLGGKKNGMAGLVLGFLLGPLGVVIAAVLPAGAVGKQEIRGTTRVLLLVALAVPVILFGLYVWMKSHI